MIPRLSYVIDTSAIVAIVAQESDADFFKSLVLESDYLCVGSTTALEATLVLERMFPVQGKSRFDEWVMNTSASIVPFTEQHFKAAYSAHVLFGKGRHPAALNFGDCMSYALAKVEDFPLVYKGDDFSKVDGISLVKPA